MNIVFRLLVVLLIASCSSTSSKIKWDASALSKPESVYFDLPTNSVFISNVAGSPLAKDGKGWISKYSSSGELLVGRWLDGLNAPKGMRSFGDKLFVSDIDEVLEISISQGQILKRYKIKNAKFLNDVATDKVGNVYVSDMFTYKVHKITKTGATVLMNKEHLKKFAPNGLYINNNKLYIATWGRGLNTKTFATKSKGAILVYDLKSKRTKYFSKNVGNLDGIEMLKDGSFITSDWISGDIYSVSKTGKHSLMMNVGQGSADIGLNTKTNTLMIPLMTKDKVLIKNLK
jgi:hypothetical protein